MLKKETPTFFEQVLLAVEIAPTSCNLVRVARQLVANDVYSPTKGVAADGGQPSMAGGGANPHITKRLHTRW